VRRVFRWSNGPDSGPRTMLLGQLTAVQVSGEGVQFASCLGFENVDAHAGFTFEIARDDGGRAQFPCGRFRWPLSTRKVRLLALYVKLEGETRCVHRGPRMDAHKFRIGQSVAYRSRGADAPQGLYVIVALLPQREDGEFEYRIKHSHEDHQRSAKESELRPPKSSNRL